MDLAIRNCCSCLSLKSCHLPLHLGFLGGDKDACGHKLLPKLRQGIRYNTKALAAQNQTKRSTKPGNTNELNKNLQSPEEQLFTDGGDHYVEVEKTTKIPDADVPSRNSVLQACIATSCFLAAFGLLIRQVSHVASTEGLPVVDCSAAITFNFELWHLELIVGSVILISSCRFLLLKIWPDFANSSNAANQQILTSLELLDYLVVAFLPGISEELLFRGALLPLLGDNWASILAVAALFGALHLGSG